MKLIVLISIVLCAWASALAAGSEAIIKQRAKELSNQNNVRQGVTPPAQQQRSAPATQPATASPQLQPVAKVQADLAAIKVNSVLKPEQKPQLARDLLSLAKSGRQPSSALVTKLADSITAALLQKNLSDGTRSRLVQDLNAAFNPATIPPAQLQEVISDVQAIFQSAGLPRNEAASIADYVKAVAAELQNPK